VLVAGTTEGSLAGANAGRGDVFVRKLDAGGREVWTHQFGTSGVDLASGVAVDAAGNVLVAGRTGGSLAGASAGSLDAFVLKLDRDGTASVQGVGALDSCSEPPSVEIREVRSVVSSTNDTTDMRVAAYAFDEDGIAVVLLDGVSVLHSSAYAGDRGKRLIEFFWTMRDFARGGSVRIEVEDTCGDKVVELLRWDVDSTTVELTGAQQPAGEGTRAYEVIPASGDSAGLGRALGTLTVSIFGLPGGDVAEVMVTGPSNYSRTVVSSSTLVVPAGLYTVTAATAGDLLYGQPLFEPQVVQQEAYVEVGGTAQVAVPYVSASPAASPRAGVDLGVLQDLPFELAPSYVRVSNVGLGAERGGVRRVSFEVAWDESWRGPDRPSWVAAADNWDAAWVFVKYRVDGGAWQHATLAYGPFVANGVRWCLCRRGRSRWVRGVQTQANSVPVGPAARRLWSAASRRSRWAMLRGS